MTNYNPPPQTPEEQQAILQQQAELRMHGLEVGAIVELGQSEFGKASFDDAARVMTEAIGNDRAQAVMYLARQMDKPAAIVMHLANNEDQLKKIAEMPPARQAVELARIENQMGGRATFGADPAWKDLAKNRGKVTEAAWRENGGDAIQDDKAWSRAFDERMAKRARR